MATTPKWHHRAGKYKREQGGGGPGSAHFKARVHGDLSRGKSTRYVWRIDVHSPYGTRQEHKALNGKTFRWDDPPVFDSRTGKRGHPGSDGRCRCYAEPILDE